MKKIIKINVQLLDEVGRVFCEFNREAYDFESALENLGKLEREAERIEKGNLLIEQLDQDENEF
jgi:hypothetical protein